MRPDATGHSLRMEGDLGTGQLSIDSLAVSVTGTDIAVVTDDRTALRRAPTATGELTTLDLEGVSDLLRPQFSRFGEIWAVGRKGDRQRMWRFTSTEDATRSRRRCWTRARSPHSGSRPTGRGWRWCARCPAGSSWAWPRSSGPTRSVSSAGGRSRSHGRGQSEPGQVARIADIAWTDATELIVLGAPTSQSTNLAPIRLRDDASRITPSHRRAERLGRPGPHRADAHQDHHRPRRQG